MKILLLANDEETIYHFRLELLDELKEKGNEVYVCCPTGEYAEEIKKHGCNLIDIKLSKRGMNPAKDLLIIKEYSRIIKEIKPDCVLTYTIKPNVYGGLACGFTGTPCIATVTGLGTAFEKEGPLKSIAVFLYRIGLMKDNWVFFQNRDHLKLFQSLNIVKDNSSIVAGSGVNLVTHCYEKYPDSKTKRMIFVGDVWKDKGIYELVEAFEKLSLKYDITLDIVGRVDESFAPKALELEDNSKIRILGRRNDVHNLIKENGVLILPSYHEGMANVILEALACGRPVIVSDIPGCNNAVKNGINGYLVEPRNSESLYEAMERFVNLPIKKREEMGIEGRKIVEEKFSRKEVTEEYLKVINKVTARG